MDEIIEEFSFFPQEVSQVKEEALAEEKAPEKPIFIDENTPIETLEELAEKGSKKAQFILGKKYKEGIDVGKDEHSASIFYYKAAFNGHKTAFLELEKLAEVSKNVTAQFYLGYMYDEGFKVHGDNQARRDEYDKKAIEYYTTAAENGSATAQNNLGLMYEDGRGTAQDFYKAKTLYRKAAKNGDEKWTLEFRGIIFE